VHTILAPWLVEQQQSKYRKDGAQNNPRFGWKIRQPNLKSPMIFSGPVENVQLPSRSSGAELEREGEEGALGSSH